MSASFKLIFFISLYYSFYHICRIIVIFYAAPAIFILFLGCSSRRISACFFAAIWMYICVVLMELCPNICCTQLISTPSSIRYVAKECLNICGVIFLLIPACFVYFFSISRTDCSVYLLPRLFIKKNPFFWISALFSSKYCFSMCNTEVLLICTYLSLPPLLFSAYISCANM